MAELTIDPRFESLLPPLTAEQNLELAALIKKFGCDDLHAWKRPDGTRVLVDGHHRKAIAERHDVPYEVRDLEFPNEQAALEWMIANQFGRRSLVPAARIDIALRMNELLQTGTTPEDNGGPANLQSDETSAKPPEIKLSERDKKHIAKVAGKGASERNVAKMFVIREDATPALHEAVTSGRVAIDPGAAIAKTCVPEVQEAVASGKITVHDARLLGNRPAAQQVDRMHRMLEIRQRQAEKESERAESDKKTKKARKPKGLAIDRRIDRMIAALGEQLDARGDLPNVGSEHYGECNKAFEAFEKAWKLWKSEKPPEPEPEPDEKKKLAAKRGSRRSATHGSNGTAAK